MPLRRLQPASRDSLLALIGPRVFADWEPLTASLGVAGSVDVLTLYVRREVQFARWMYGNHFARNPGGAVRSVLAAIHGDGSDDDALHRAVYRAWAAFVEEQGVRRHLVLDASDACYRELPLAALR